MQDLANRPATALELHVTGATARQTGPLDALAAARRRFLKGERVDMQELASELGVNRATLYRWVGSRELLLGEVLWSLAEGLIEESRARARGKGVDWMTGFYEHFTRVTAESSAIRTFFQNEPELAMRVLTSNQGVQHQRLVDTMRGTLEEKVDAGELSLRLPPADLAYVLVRVAESFIWRDFFTGDRPDVDKAVQVARVLLT